MSPAIFLCSAKCQPIVSLFNRGTETITIKLMFQMPTHPPEINILVNHINYLPIIENPLQSVRRSEAVHGGKACSSGTATVTRCDVKGRILAESDRVGIFRKALTLCHQEHRVVTAGWQHLLLFDPFAALRMRRWSVRWKYGDTVGSISIYTPLILQVLPLRK